MISYLISLARRPDRRANALKECAKAGITPTVFDAIDGRTLPIPPGWGGGMAGAYGCNRSHCHLLRQSGTDPVMMLEDDVTFIPNFQERFDLLMGNLPDDWDAVFLGGGHSSPPYRVNEHVCRAVAVQRTHSYMLRGDYIQTLLNLWEREPGHIDQVWARHQGEAKIYCPIRWLAGQTESRSDIDGRHHGNRWWGAKRIIPTGCGTCGMTAPPPRRPRNDPPPPGRRWK